MGNEEPLSLSKADMLAARHRIQIDLPHIGERFVVTSPKDYGYNCIAWAAADIANNWWPGIEWWPKKLTEKGALDEIISAFNDLGYFACNDGTLELGFEKIAIFTKQGRPKHMARQFPSGQWTTKLGVLYDIVVEDLADLTGGSYGKINYYMKRAIRTLK
jgi:hypothetical protein